MGQTMLDELSEIEAGRACYIEEGFMISPEEFKNEMQKWSDAFNSDNYYLDEEYIHIKQDELMCKTLQSLGYGEGVKIFNATPKWYS